MASTPIILQNLPESLEKRIVARAEQERVPLDVAVILMLQDKAPALEREVLNELFGKWSLAELEEFDAATADTRRIDAA
jgi:hypothetical protein